MTTEAMIMEALGDVQDLEVEKISKEATVELDPTNKVMVVHDGARMWSVGEESYRSVMQYFGVSGSLVKRLSSGTASSVATEIMQSKGRASAIVRGLEMVGLAPKGRYKPLPVSTVLETIDEAVGGLEWSRAMVLPRYRVRLEMLGEAEAEVAKGDLVRAGVMVDFSPIGLSDPLVQTFGLRLVCTNGATSNVVLETHTLTSDEDDNREWLAGAVASAYKGLDSAVDKWKELAHYQVAEEERPLLLGALAKAAKLKASEQTSLFARAVETPPDTAWDVFNLMTWLSTHVMQDPRRVALAQMATAAFAHEDTYHKHCPTCNRAGG